MKHLIIKILTLFFLLFFFGKSFSQQYFVKTYTITDGLPTRNINDACQDKNGIMWFATSFGISKYDGFSFTNYRVSDGLPEQLYRKIKVDEKGILWAMPDSKLDTIVYYKNLRWSKISPPPKKAYNYQMNSFDIIYKNNKAVICMGSFDGYYVYEDGKWTHFSISDNKDLNYVYTVLAKNQKFYLSTKIGVCIVENGKTDWSLNKYIEPFSKDIIALNFENKNTPDEKIWLLTETWLGYIQHNSFHVVTTQFQLPHPSIFYYAFLNCDSKGNIFFGNIWAKYFIPTKSNIPVPLMFDNGFSSHGATSLFVDREQNIWITDTRGINKINNLKVVNYFRKNGMLEDEVTAIAEMNDGRIVLGHNNGLSILSNNSFKTIEIPDLKQNTRRISDMVKDKAGNIWFASISRGLGKLQPNGNITWYSTSDHQAITVVHQDNSGRIWVGADKKIMFLQNNKLVAYPPFKEENNIIRKIFSDEKSGIIVVGSNGLWKINHDKIHKIPSPADGKANNVFSYFKDKKGTEFVGTIHGLYTITNDSLIKYNYKGIEINNPVFFIFQDHGGSYWFGSNVGAYKWDGDTHLELYGVTNGLAGWETNRAAGMPDSKGRVWIGTDRGLSCFEPEYDKINIPVPVLNLISVEDSKGILHSLTERSSINYTNSTLIFHFRGISFFNENLMEYRYKLEGFDNTWQEVSQSMLDKVKYIGLRPGKYTFCVMAKNFAGTWSEISRSGIIRITPPFYFTWWFLLLALLLLSTIIYGFIRINVQRAHNSKLKKEIVERKRIEEALKESRQKYLDLVELLPETVYETDSLGNIVYMNDTGYRLFGYPHTVFNSEIPVKQLIAPESHELLEKLMATVLEAKLSNKAVLKGIKLDGTKFPLSLHTSPVILRGVSIGTRGIIIDQTEQQKFESQLQKNTEDLKALNTSKDKFFSIIAHDLRSPFTSFLGFTEILDEEIDTLPKEELQTIISSMRQSAMNLYQLLENLLEWSLLQRDITRYEPKIVPLLPAVNDCIDISLDILRKKKIDLRIEIDNNINVVVDIHMFQTIIRNLLSNAIKFTHRGGFIQISAAIQEKHFVTLSVKDTGIGINADLLQKIFRLDINNNTKGTEGELSTGLGLILCKEFVEKHGGKIWVDSEEGKGSTFYFMVKGFTE